MHDLVLGERVRKSIVLGPFATSFHRTFADQVFLRAAEEFVLHHFVPAIDPEASILETRVFTRYDEDRFTSPTSACKYFFCVTTLAVYPESYRQLCAEVRADAETKQLTLRPRMGVQVKVAERAVLEEWACARRQVLGPCPCCGYRVVCADPDYLDCPICGWFNDGCEGYEEHGGYDLAQAQENFRRYGCIYPPGHCRHRTAPARIAAAAEAERLYANLLKECDPARRTYLLFRWREVDGGI